MITLKGTSPVVLLALALVAARASAEQKPPEIDKDQILGTWAVWNPEFGKSWSVEFDPDGSFLAAPIPRMFWQFRIEGNRLKLSAGMKHGKPTIHERLALKLDGEQLEISDPTCSAILRLKRLAQASPQSDEILGAWRAEETGLTTGDAFSRCKTLYWFSRMPVAVFSSDGWIVLGVVPYCAFRGQYRLTGGTIQIFPQGGMPFDAKATLSSDQLKLRIRPGWRKLELRKIRGSEYFPLIVATAEENLESCDAPRSIRVGTPPWPGPL